MRARILLITPMILGAPLAFGESHAGGTHKVGFNYHIWHDQNDHGFKKEDGGKDPSKEFSTNANAYVNITGGMGKTTYNVNMNVLAKDLASAVEVALASTEVCKGTTMSVGRNYVNMGGYDNANYTGQTIMASVYNMGLKPLPGSDQLLQFDSDFGAGGTVTLQVINDVVVTDADGDGAPDAGSKGYFNKAPQSQPIFALQWVGNFGMVSPMVQLIQYDTSHSMYTSFGLAADVAGAKIHFDYIMDTREMMVATKKEKTTTTELILDLTYNAGMVTPFLKYAKHDVKQPTDDWKGNLAAGSMEDNYTQLLVGTTINMYDHLVPYLAYQGRSAMVLKKGEPVTGKTDSKSEASILLGFRGEL